MTLVPRPVSQPVECWQPIVSANPRGLDFMARHGMKGIVGGGSALMAERPITAVQGSQCAGRARPRAWPEPLPWPELPHRRNARESHPRGDALLRRAPEAVRPARHGPDAPRTARPRWRSAAPGPEKNIPSLDRAVETGSWYCGPPEGFVGNTCKSSRTATPAWRTSTCKAAWARPWR